MYYTSCINFSLSYWSFVFISANINNISKYKNSKILKLYMLEWPIVALKGHKKKTSM